MGQPWSPIQAVNMKLLFGVLLLASAALANTAPEQGSCLDEVMLEKLQKYRELVGKQNLTALAQIEGMDGECSFVNVVGCAGAVMAAVMGCIGGVALAQEMLLFVRAVFWVQ